MALKIDLNNLWFQSVGGSCNGCSGTQCVEWIRCLSRGILLQNSRPNELSRRRSFDRRWNFSIFFAFWNGKSMPRQKYSFAFNSWWIGNIDFNFIVIIKKLVSYQNFLICREIWWLKWRAPCPILVSLKFLWIRQERNIQSHWITQFTTLNTTPTMFPRSETTHPKELI